MSGGVVGVTGVVTGGGGAKDTSGVVVYGVGSDRLYGVSGCVAGIVTVVKDYIETCNVTSGWNKDNCFGLDVDKVVSDKDGKLSDGEGLKEVEKVVGGNEVKDGRI